MGTQPTGEQLRMIDARIGEIQRQVHRQKEGYPFDADDLAQALQMIIEGRFGDVRSGLFPQIPTGSFLKQLRNGETLSFGQTECTPRKLTADCFYDKRYYQVESLVNDWLPREQKEGGKGKIWIYELLRPVTVAKIFTEMFALRNSSPETILTGFEGRHCTWELPEIENLVARHEAGEDLGLRKDGGMNLFPLGSELGSKMPYIIGLSFCSNENNENDTYWSVQVIRADDGRQWKVGTRIFLAIGPSSHKSS